MGGGGGGPKSKKLLNGDQNKREGANFEWKSSL